MTNVQIYGLVSIGSALLIKRVVRYLKYRLAYREGPRGLVRFLFQDLLGVALWLVFLAAQCLLVLGIGVLMLELFNRYASA